MSLLNSSQTKKMGRIYNFLITNLVVDVISVFKGCLLHNVRETSYGTWRSYFYQLVYPFLPEFAFSNSYGVHRSFPNFNKKDTPFIVCKNSRVPTAQEKQGKKLNPCRGKHRELENFAKRQGTMTEQRENTGNFVC